MRFKLRIPSSFANRLASISNTMAGFAPTAVYVGQASMGIGSKTMLIMRVDENDRHSSHGSASET